MAEKANYHAPEPQPQLTDEEAEIQSLLWPFYNNTEPQTLQDIGFDLNITPELMYLFVPFSSDSVHDVASKCVQPVSNHELQPPSRVLQIDATNDSSEVNGCSKEPFRMREKNGDGSGVNRSPGVNHSSEEPNWIQGRVKDGSGVTSEAADPALEVNHTSEKDKARVTAGAATHSSEYDHSSEEQVRMPRMGGGSGEISEAKQEFGQYSIICIEDSVNEYANVVPQF
ncbi:hypothetical protein PHJA_001208200 [Phtheirospermum japonicum]|uniref:Uncharacterized protein n=1 Tax=Phtheirospermum japonicum TaxID=374723 RepID=A0A830C8S7_9LAMI|nr:hypothetical protein PHJA_001208200 [Phtheirospermum japonicum]